MNVKKGEIHLSFICLERLLKINYFQCITFNYQFNYNFEPFALNCKLLFCPADGLSECNLKV